jgi:hypothetical protein
MLRTCLTLAILLAVSTAGAATTPATGAATDAANGATPVDAGRADTPAPPFSRTEERAPCGDYFPDRQPFFGDLHVHTALSFDASSQDTRNMPADAYRFAQGEPMGIQPYDDAGRATRTIRLDRPLDFTAVTDHAEFLGEVRICTTPGMPDYWHPVCLVHRYLPRLSFMTFGAAGLSYKHRWGLCGENNATCYARAADAWRDIQQAAEDAYDRSDDCEFTTFVGYEWTAGGETGQNLHHNVIFRNAQVPDAVAIPHNSNLSGGLMFETARVANKVIPVEPVTKEEAMRRARWNPLFEVVQHKGASECDSRLPTWSEDEFCGFELMGYDRFGGKNTGANQFAMLDWLSPVLGEEMIPVTTAPSEANFLRFALKKGLQQQAELGANSFRYGLISSTDTHIAAPGLTMERNHPGHGGAGMGARDGVPAGLPDELEYGPGGLAVLYAEENSRDALFAAMQRREAYATSGTRPVLRFFGGWEYPDEVCVMPALVSRGYAGGVPMGGELPPAPRAGLAPRFIVSAGMDHGTREYPGSPLERIQVVKGWYAEGALQERVLTVAGGDKNAGVNIDTCEPTGGGHAQLCSVWQDDDFNPAAQAFYYTRVLETPTCRWSQRLCAEAGVRCDAPQSIPEGMENCCAPEHEKVIQERAWSSPIWYVPSGP